MGSGVQADAVQRIKLLAIVVCVLLEIENGNARKRLVPTQSADSVIQSNRSPLYDTRTGYQIITEEDNGYPQITNGNDEDDHYHPPAAIHHHTSPTFIPRKKHKTTFSNTFVGIRSTSKSQALSAPITSTVIRRPNTHPLGSDYFSTPAPTDHYRNLPSQAPTDDGKKYAFAYAVRPKIGYTDVANDFSLSHKESRDGKITMGEYKVLLPDGRLQVVRYTADGKSGFKADVTYEDEEQRHSYEHSELVKPLSKPTSEIQKHYVQPPTYQSQSSPFKVTPSLSPTPVKIHPSLSPSLVYDHPSPVDHHLEYVQHLSFPTFSNSISPAHQVLYQASPTQIPYRKVSLTSSGGLLSMKRAIGNNLSPFQKTSIPTPSSIYDKLSPHYAPVSHGQRAGPYIPSPADVIHQPLSSPRQAQETAYFATPSPFPAATLLHAPETDPRTVFPVRSRKSQILQPFVYKPPSSKTRLTPIENFKAGPTQSTHHLSSNGHEVNDHHFLVHHDENDLAVQPPHEVTPLQGPIGLSPIKSSLATFTSNLAISGISTPKPPIFIKSKKLTAVGRPIKPSVGGLVYLETPAHGPRPTSLGVGEVLSRLPHGNIPKLPKTTTHPYEVGSKDYGSNVGYSPTAGGNVGSYQLDTNHGFRPSPEIPQEVLPHGDPHDHRHHNHHHSREFLSDQGATIVNYSSKLQDPILNDQSSINY